MRKEIGGQVRKTFSGGRTESIDVWDVATTEIPAEVGESPECQWCPICRAARQFRDSGPGIGGHISGAGSAVAAAVQDAMNAFDTVLSKASGTAERDRQERDRQERDRQERDRQERARRDRTRSDWQSGTRPGPGAGATAGHTAERTGAPLTMTPGPIVVPGADSPETAEAAGRGAPEPGGPAVSAGSSPSAGPAETAVLGSPASEPDAWSLVTDRAEGGTDAPGADVTAHGQVEDDGRNGPDDRG